MKTIQCPFVLAVAVVYFHTTELEAATKLVSVPDSSFAPSATVNGNSMAPQFSNDGRFLVFTSEASNLVTNDHNGEKLDVFVKELASGKITLVSATPNGESGHDSSYSPTISSNGQFVVFLSQATNLVPKDTNDLTDVFLRDLAAGTTTLVSVSADGSVADGESFKPLVSGDGRFVCFASRASDLVIKPDLDQERIDLFLRDRANNQTTHLSESTIVQTGPDADVEDYTISEDGHWIAFTTTATLGAPTTIYLHDIEASSTTPVMIDPASVPAGRTPVAATALTLSSDGRYLALQTDPSSVATTNAGIYLSDLRLGTNLWIPGARLSPNSFGFVQFPPAFSADGETLAFLLRIPALSFPAVHLWTSDGGVRFLTSPATGRTNAARVFALSSSGTRVAFISDETNLISPATPRNEFQLYIHDLPSNTLRLISADSRGQPVGGVEYALPQFSPDGRYLAFQSRSAALVPNDRNNAEDIFLYDWEANSVSIVSAPLENNRPFSSSSRGSSFIARGLSADGRHVLFASTANDLVPGDENGLRDLFVRDLVTGRTKLVNVNTDGGALALPVIREAVLSANGRFAAFTAEDSQLLPNETAVASRAYLRDVALGRTVLVSVNTNGVPAAGRPSQISVSADGRYVAFVSDNARDLVPGVLGPVATVLRDVKLDKTMIVEPNDLRVGISGAAPSLSGLGGKVLSTLAARFILRVFLLDAEADTRLEFDAASGSFSAMSYDGRRVALFSQGGGIPPVLRWGDLPVESLREIVLPPDGLSSGILSANGRFAAVGVQKRLSPPFGEAPVLVELATGAIRHLDLRPDGQISSTGNSFEAGLDADARHAVFRSEASDLVALDANGLPDIFVRDLAANATTLVNSSSDGAPANDFSFHPLISANGRVIVFSSWADNLVSGDINHAGDIFAVELPPRPFSDSDGDKLDDLWELSNFGNLLRDGTGDYDEDGASEGVEFVSGTSPINDLSVFEVTATLRRDGNLAIAWTTEPGRNYRLQSRDAIEAGWQPVGEVVPGDGNTVSRTVSLSGARQRFYRVVLLE